LATRTADGDLNDLACGQGEVATDLGASTAGACTKRVPTATALCAKGEDLIRIGGRYRKVDEASGIGESNTVAWPPGPDAASPRNAVTASNSRFILSSPMRRTSVTSANEALSLEV
jgi:hypothetical protein